jgi:hypothetical protein
MQKEREKGENIEIKQAMAWQHDSLVSFMKQLNED